MLIIFLLIFDIILRNRSEGHVCQMLLMVISYTCKHDFDLLNKYNQFLQGI